MHFFVALLSIPLLLIAQGAAGSDLDNLVPNLLETFPTDVNYTPRVTLLVPGVRRPQAVVFNQTTNNVNSGSWTGTFSGDEALDSLSSQVQSQINRVPLGASVAAFTFGFDTATNTFVRTTEGLGPLLAERAQTTGKQKLNVAYSYSFAKFKIFEGHDLDNLKVSYAGTEALQPTAGTGMEFDSGTGGTLSISVPLSASPSFGGNNLIQFTNAGSGSIETAELSGTASGDIGALDLATFTSGSLTVPDPTTRLDLDLTVQSFVLFGTYGITDTIDVGVVIPLLDVAEEGRMKIIDGFADPDVTPSSPFVARSQDSSFGLGDVIFRGKWQFLTAEQAYVDQAVRADVSVPTGEEDDFRGTGNVALGCLYVASKDFGIWSPHLNAGFNFPIGDSHESTFVWDVGLDTWVLPRLTLVADFLGAQKLNPDGNGDLILSLAGGVKWNIWQRLVIGASVIGRLNDEGLRADVIPSGTIEYTFF